MEIVGAAALIAMGIVIASVLYGRTHSSGPAAAAAAVAAERDSATATALQAALAERGTDLERREATLAKREADVEQEHSRLADSRLDVERTLERVTTMGRPFPEGAKDKQRSYIIPFNMKTKRGAA